MPGVKFSTAVRKELEAGDDLTVICVLKADARLEEVETGLRAADLRMGANVSVDQTKAVCVSGPGNRILKFVEKCDWVTQVQLVPVLLCS